VVVGFTGVRLRGSARETSSALWLSRTVSARSVVHESWSLGRVDAKQWTPEAAVFVDARGSVGPAAVAEGEFAACEVAEEFLPFLIGWGAVLQGGTQFAAAGEECAVAVDGLLRVDRLIPHGGIEVAVRDHELGDVREHTVHHGVGDEDGLSIDTIELYERNMIDELALRLVHGDLPVGS
jgi:hypothetical protein